MKSRSSFSTVRDFRKSAPTSATIAPKRTISEDMTNEKVNRRKRLYCFRKQPQPLLVPNNDSTSSGEKFTGSPSSSTDHKQAQPILQQVPNPPLCCPICGWAPKPRANLTKEHIKRSIVKHRTRRHQLPAYACPVPNCEVAFTRKDNVRPHLLEKHLEYIQSEVAASGHSDCTNPDKVCEVRASQLT